MARRAAWCAGAVTVFGLSHSAAAAKVVVYRTAGPNAAPAHTALVEALTQGLTGHALLLRERPRAWRRTGIKTATRLARAMRTAEAEVGIDSLVVKRRHSVLWLVAVKSNGEVIFDKALRIGDDARVREVAKSLALAVAEHLRPRGALPATPQ